MLSTEAAGEDAEELAGFFDFEEVGGGEVGDGGGGDGGAEGEEFQCEAVGGPGGEQGGFGGEADGGHGEDGEGELEQGSAE